MTIRLLLTIWTFHLNEPSKEVDCRGKLVTRLAPLPLHIGDALCKNLHYSVHFESCHNHGSSLNPLWKITLFSQTLGSQAMHKIGVFLIIFSPICQSLGSVVAFSMFIMYSCTMYIIKSTKNGDGLLLAKSEDGQVKAWDMDQKGPTNWNDDPQMAQLHKRNDQRSV